MFPKKRQLRKNKSKHKIKTAFTALFFLLIILLIFEYLYLNFSFGKKTYISPIAINKTPKLSSYQVALDNANIQVISVALNTDNSAEVKLKDGGVVILSSKKDIGSQISSLQLMLSRLTIEGKKLKILDFRFDNPVVSF